MRTLQDHHARQTLFTRSRSHFLNQWTRLSFGDQVHNSDTISNRSPLFGVWKKCKVYMSNWQIHLTFTSFSWFSGYSYVFVFWSCFFILYAIGLLYLVCRTIVRCICPTGSVIWPWPYCHGSVVRVKFMSFVLFLYYIK